MHGMAVGYGYKCVLSVRRPCDIGHPGSLREVGRWASSNGRASMRELPGREVNS